MPSSIPEQFGRYRILRLLGQGGMGAVYLANDSQLGRDVALKIPSLDGPDSAQMVERFSREARAAATLHHPNICPVYDVGEIDGKPYLTMRFIEGRPLTKFINPEKPQNPKNVAVVIRKLALALAEAHHHGVVHRDLKPANIMIDSKNEPVVMDFGLARQMGGANEKQVTQSGMILGTPAYMSPEQIVGDPAAIDHRTDIWSLGVILFEMLTGQLPYDGSVLQIVGAIQHVEPPLASDKRPALPERIVAICRKMMTRDKSQRYQSMTEVAADLAAFQKAAATGSQTAGATSDGALQSMALPRSGNEPHTQTPRSLLDALATGAKPGVSSDSARTTVTSPEGNSSGALETLLQSIVRSSGALLRGRRKGNHAKGGNDKRTATRWALPAAAVCGALLLISMIYAMSGRSERPAASTNSGTKESTAATPSGPQPPTIDPQPATTWHGWPADAPKPAIAPFDAAQAKKHQEEWAAYLKVPVEYTNSIGMKFRLIPPGEFLQGATEQELGELLKMFEGSEGGQGWARSCVPRHKTVLTRPFYLGVHEVTQQQFETIAGRNPSAFAKGSWSPPHAASVAGLDTSSHPVDTVDWNEAVDFCMHLSERNGFAPFDHRSSMPDEKDGIGYRLPTEAEWEFACRAGTTTRHSTGDTEDALRTGGWMRANSGNRTHAVGELAPNPFGMCDMHGNLHEWTGGAENLGYYDQFAQKPAVDPREPPSDKETARPFRGGGWFDVETGCLSCSRQIYNFWGKDTVIGFRVALSIEAVRQASPRPKPAVAPFDAAQAKKHQEEWAAYLKVPVEYTNSIGMKFRLIPPGEFLMGSTEEQQRDIAAVLGAAAGAAPELDSPRQHRVVLTRPFFLGIHEVTQRQFADVLHRNPSYFSKGDLYVEGGAAPAEVARLETSNFPVENVSWNDAAEFCAELSRREMHAPCYARSGSSVTRLKGDGYRLPSEAEWEFSCRAGSTTKYWSGNDEAALGRAGWWSGNGGWRMRPVGQLAPNSFGLYDVHGGVWELVQDLWSTTYFDQFRNRPAIDPSGPALTSNECILRGGCWFRPANVATSALRHSYLTDALRFDVGFRAALSIDAVKQSLSRPKPAVAPFDAAQARKHQDEWAAFLKLPVEYTNSVGMKFRLIPPGEYVRGQSTAEIEAIHKLFDHPVWKEWASSTGPQHTTILTQPLYVGVHEVTQRQYQAVVGTNPSSLSSTGEFADNVKGVDTSDYPVETIFWNEAVDFCEALSRREGLSPFNVREYATKTRVGAGYRLLTSAQWEFACRAGTTTRFWCGDTGQDLLKTDWLRENAGYLRNQPVGRLAANPFGLFDLHGNVQEWTEDAWDAKSYEAFAKTPAVDPFGVATDHAFYRRNLKGGGANSVPEYSTAGNHFPWGPPGKGWDIGLRVAIPAESVRRLIARSNEPPAPGPKPAVAPFDAAQAKKHQEEWAAYLKVPVEYTNSIGMKFRLIPPGEFTMGRPDSEAALFPGEKIGTRDQPAHKVTLTKPLYLGVTEVTQKQWQQMKQSAPWSGKMHGLNDERVPASYINRSAAIDFCRKLSALESCACRLPTEAEWEYACRAGSTTAYWFGDDRKELTSHAWERRNAADKPHPVAEKSANPWGLYDMHGNIAEWCADSYGPYSAEPVTDPLISASGDRWVTRGGAFWHLFHVDYRSAYRAAIPDLGNSEQGFRVAVSVDDVKRSLAEKHVDSPPVDPEWQRELVFSDDCRSLLEKPPLPESVTQTLRDGVRRLEYRNHKTTIPATFQWPTDVTGDHECEVRLRTSAEISFWHNLSQPSPGVSGENLVWIVRNDGGNNAFHVIMDPKPRFVSHYWNRIENEIDLREWTTLNLRLVDGRLTASVNGKVFQQHPFTRKPVENPNAKAGYVVSLGSNGDVALEFASIKVWRWTRRKASSVGVPAGPPPKPAVAPFDAAQAKKHQEEWAAYLKVPVEYTNSIGMKFRLIPPGEFTMGSTKPEIDAALKQLRPISQPSGTWPKDSVASESPQHRVVLTMPTYLSVYETTQEQYQAVMGELVPPRFAAMQTPVDDDGAKLPEQDAKNHPAQSVSWGEAATFCVRLSAREGLSPNYHLRAQHDPLPPRLSPADGYLLPTEAQWEFACRAGAEGSYWKGTQPDSIVEVGWILTNSKAGVHRVGGKPANPFGFHDMHGNVSEWCHDVWRADSYASRKAPVTDPVELLRSGEELTDGAEVRRGGGFGSAGVFARSGSRAAFKPSLSSSETGFRVALTAEAVRKRIAPRPPADEPQPGTAPSPTPRR